MDIPQIYNRYMYPIYGNPSIFPSVIHQETASYALWKVCEGDDAIVYRQRVMEVGFEASKMWTWGGCRDENTMEIHMS